MSEPAWWQRGAIYQIYPRSFADSNGDGVGDLKGITAHLDHLQALQVEAIWLSPIFTSPMADFGYDVSDYCDVDPVFGTLGDLDELIAQCHAREHQARPRLGPEPQLRPAPVVRRVPLQPREPQARLVRLARRAQRLGVGRSRPSAPRGPSTRPRGQYYLHSFMRRAARPQLGQPRGRGRDARRAALLDGPRRRRAAARRDRARSPRTRCCATRRAPRAATTRTGSRSTTRLRGIRKVIDEYEDRMIVGEVALQDLHRVVGYLESGDQLHLAHNFVFIDQDWDAETYADLDRRLRGAGRGDGLAGVVPRPTTTTRGPRSRFDHDGLGAQRARAILVMLYALRGTPFIYPGRGARAAGRADPARPRRRRRRPRPRARADPVDARGARPRLHHRRARGCRSSTEAATLNAAHAGRRPALHAQPRAQRSPACARRAALQVGEQRPFDAGPGHPGLDARQSGETLLAAVNFTADELPLDAEGALVLSSDPDREAASASLGPSEALLLRL